jgi:hypothetical protein
MQRLFDKLIGYMRAIEVASVDMGDTELNNLAQDRECTVVVCWRPEYTRTSQLHGTVPHASKGQIISELESASGQCGGRHTLLPDINRNRSHFTFQCKSAHSRLAKN